mmetsp:Transcript_14449/g.50264  ORF Transcript_14449/g.50264 Transcript_14449/m.50264 type:complete len:294 (+) Transcript_14449:295-1176(+)
MTRTASASARAMSTRESAVPLARSTVAALWPFASAICDWHSPSDTVFICSRLPSASTMEARRTRSAASCLCIASCTVSVGVISSSSTLMISSPQLWHTRCTLRRRPRSISSREASVSSRPMSPMMERSAVCTSFSTAWLRSYVSYATRTGSMSLYTSMGCTWISTLSRVMTGWFGKSMMFSRRSMRSVLYCWILTACQLPCRYVSDSRHVTRRGWSANGTSQCHPASQRRWNLPYRSTTMDVPCSTTRKRNRQYSNTRPIGIPKYTPRKMLRSSSNVSRTLSMATAGWRGHPE